MSPSRTASTTASGFMEDLLSYSEIESFLPDETSNERPNLNGDAEQRLLRDRRLKQILLEDKRLQLSRLQEEVKQIEDDLQSYGRIFDPVRRLPHDVWLEIFHLARDADETNDSLMPMADPWRLSHVSRKWRGIALSAPTLWTNIRIDFDRGDLDRRQALALLLSIHIYRSQNQLLDVTLDNRVDTDKYHPLLPALLASATRWKKLSMHISARCISFLEPIQWSLTSLESLALRYVRVNNHAFGGKNPDAQIFQNSSNLRSLSMNRDMTAHLQFPWNVIRIFRGRFSWAVYHDIIRKAVNSTSWDVTVLPASALPGTPCPKALPSMTKLSITRPSGQGRRRPDASSVLQGLSMPSLTELRIKSRESLAEDFNHLIPFIQRSHCNLQYLSLVKRDALIEFESPDKLIKSLPSSLKVLEIGLLSDDATLQTFSSLDASGILPNLQQLLILNEILLDVNCPIIQQLKIRRPNISVDYLQLADDWSAQ